MYIADATAQLFMLSQFIQLHFQALLNYLFRSCICVSLLCIYFSLFCLYSRLKALLTCFFLMFLGCGLVCCCAYCVTVFERDVAYSGGPVGLNFVSSHQLWNVCSLILIIILYLLMLCKQLQENKIEKKKKKNKDCLKDHEIKCTKHGDF